MKFPNELFVDRFMIEYKKDYLKIRQDLMVKRRDIENKRRLLLDIMKYKSSSNLIINKIGNMSIIDSLKNTIEYI